MAEAEQVCVPVSPCPEHCSDHSDACVCAGSEPDPGRQTGRLPIAPRALGYLARFGGWWLGMTGLVATFSVCPCCGQPACPVGAGGIGAVGAFIAMLWKRTRRVFNSG